MSKFPFSGAFISAQLTNPSTVFRDNIGVFIRESMSPFTVFFKGSFGITSIGQGSAIVFLRGYEFKMVGVNAKLPSTKMVNLECGWYSSLKRFITDSVRSVVTTIFPKHTVAVGYFCSYPNPASIRLDYLFPISWWQHYINSSINGNELTGVRS